MIRPATVKDAAAIAAIWNPVIRDTTYSFHSGEKSPGDVAQQIAARHDDGFGFWVAEIATQSATEGSQNSRSEQSVEHGGESRGAIVGFASYAQFRAGNGYAHAFEHTIVLAPQARGLRLGRALMDELEAHARARGGHTMNAGVSAENTAGLRFHAALGYELVAVVPQVGHKFGRWLDLHIMQKFL